MNVFEFLGLPANHRTGNKIVMHVKNATEVPESKKSYPVIAQIKKDGVYALVVKRTDHKVGIFGRSGKQYTNTDKLIANIDRFQLINPGVYIAELCCDVCSLEALSGIVNPNRNKELTHEQSTCKAVMYLAYHDCIGISDFVEGDCPLSYKERYRLLVSRIPNSMTIIGWTMLYSQVEEDKLLKQAIESVEEGLVLKNPDEGYVCGHKGHRQYKRVRGVSYDLRCIGIEEGKGKYKGKVANLIFKWKDGKEIKAMLGKGWTHEDAEDMFEGYKDINKAVSEDDLEAFNEPSPYGLADAFNPVGDIFEVYALQESSKGKLRLPKVGELRHDKDKPDVGE